MDYNSCIVGDKIEPCRGDKARLVVSQYSASLHIEKLACQGANPFEIPIKGQAP